MKIYRAWHDTRHFDFEAYGLSPEKAIELLIKGWKIHCKQYNVAPYYRKETILEIKREEKVDEIEMDKAYRDRTAIG